MQKIFSTLIQFSAMLLLLVAVSAQSAVADDKQQACFEVTGTELLANSLDDVEQGQLKPLITAYFADSTGEIEIDAIAGQQFLTDVCKGSFAVPSRHGALWLRFKVNNSHASDQDWVIAFMETIFDEVILFEQRDANLVTVARNGRTVPLMEKANRTAGSAIPFSIDAGEEKLFYLRLHGTLARGVSPLIASKNLFSAWTDIFRTLLLAQLIFIATMIVISLLLFRQVEARFSRYYMLFLGCQFVYAFLFDGWLIWVVDVTPPVTVIVPIMELTVGLSILANIQYCRVLLTQGSNDSDHRSVFFGLTGITVITTIMSVIDPWMMSAPLHLFLIFSPMVLLVIAIKKIRLGLPQAMPIAASLIVFMLGLSVAVYYFVFPIAVVETSSITQLMRMQSLTLGYNFAVFGEAVFMMIAISTMVNAMRAKGQAATIEAEALQRQMIVAQNQREEVQKVSSERIKALENILVDDPKRNLHTPAEQQFVQRATQAIQDHVSDDSFDVKELAAALGVSGKTLSRRLKTSHGSTPAAFIRSVRLNFARDLILLHQFRTVAEVAHAAGFSSASHFAKLYQQQFKELPKQTFASLKAPKNPEIPMPRKS